MNYKIESMTESGATLVVVFNGMVSITRGAKSPDYKQTKEKRKNAAGQLETWNIPNMERDIVMVDKKAQQICNLRPEFFQHALYSPTKGFNEVSWKKIADELKVYHHLAEHARAIAGVSSYTWYIQE